MRSDQMRSDLVNRKMRAHAQRTLADDARVLFWTIGRAIHGRGLTGVDDRHEIWWPKYFDIAFHVDVLALLKLRKSLAREKLAREGHTRN